MAPNSLFAILLRSGWWVSAALAVALAASALALLPPAYQVLGTVSAVPFLVIAGIAAWRQWRAPSDAAIARTLEAVRAMSWPQLSAALEEGFRREGYEVERLDGRPADLRLTKAFRTTLVLARKWKVARTGIEPLRDLDGARDAAGAHACIYVTTGEVSDNARRFAAERGLQLMLGADVARLLPALRRRTRPATPLAPAGRRANR